MDRETGPRRGAVPRLRRTIVMSGQYWRQASLDLDVAGSLFQPNHYYAAADYAHEALEKALKAACWHLRAEEPPFTHDLTVLVELLAERIGDLPAFVMIAADYLDPIFKLVRYPSGKGGNLVPGELISEERAREAVKLAGEVMTWVQELLQQEPGRPRRSKRT